MSFIYDNCVSGEVLRFQKTGHDRHDGAYYTVLINASLRKGFPWGVVDYIAIIDMVISERYYKDYPEALAAYKELVQGRVAMYGEYGIPVTKE